MSERVKIEAVEPLSHRWAKLDRYTIRYTRRDGTIDTLVREVHDHGHGATVLPYDKVQGTVLLVRQFRLPVQIYGEYGFILEACAGLLDGNDPAECAKREAEEELGFRLSNLRQVASTFMTPGAVTEHLTMFLADYSHDGRISDGGGHAHEGEDIEVVEMPFEQLRAMMQKCEIVDAKTVMLIMFLERELGLPPL